jgi:hypothetical protein
MTKFRKKPVEVEAMLIAHIIKMANSDSAAWDAIPDWVTDNMSNGTLLVLNDHVEISTLEGVMRGEKDDYLIQGVKGEIYACKPDIFEKTYELIDEGRIESKNLMAYD